MPVTLARGCTEGLLVQDVAQAFRVLREVLTKVAHATVEVLGHAPPDLGGTFYTEPVFL